MEREVSMVVEIGVALIALAAFIAILWFTVFMGEDLSNSLSMEASELLARNESGKLQELSESYTILPTSAVYSILRSNESVIGEVQCKICGAGGDEGEIGNGRCILGHLDGKVSLEVVFLDDEGWYKLIIHNRNCDWYYDELCTSKLCS